MSFTDFINQFQPTYKLHSTGKSFCIQTQNEIPTEYKKMLEFTDFPHKIYWNSNAKCWLISTIYEQTLKDNNISKMEIDDFQKERQELLEEREAFLKEKQAFMEEKEKLNRTISIQKNYIVNIRKKMKTLEETTEHLTDSEINNIYTKIFQFMRHIHTGGIEKGTNLSSNKAIHDIKLCRDNEKNLYLIKYKNSKDEWDYNTDYMYLPKLRK